MVKIIIQIKIRKTQGKVLVGKKKDFSKLSIRQLLLTGWSNRLQDKDIFSKI